VIEIEEAEEQQEKVMPMKKGILRPVIALFIVGFILSAASAYILTTMYYLQEKKEYERTIAVQKDDINYLEAQLAQLKNIKIDCPDCHGGATKEYHTVKKISLIDQVKGKNPRICTTCHGLDVHDIHMNKLVKGELTCEKCHLKNESLVVVPELRPGDILSCEQCHNDGNYIAIHLESGSGTCANCHIGGVGKIHEPTMANIEEVLKRAEAERKLTNVSGA
jgi:hypothetical protein